MRAKTVSSDAADVLADVWNELRAQNWANAARQCETILTKNPSSSEALRALAMAFWGQGRSSDALTALERAAEIQPTDPNVWSDLGVLRYQARDPGGAEKAFAASLRLQPLHLTALHGRAESLLRLFRYQEARRLFEECVRLAPERLYFLRSLGQCLAEEGYLEEAQRVVEVCVARDPQCGKSLLLLAGIRHRQLHLDDALELTEAAVRVSPGSFASRARLALAYWNCGDLEQAIKAREEALALEPSDSNLHSNLTWLALHDPKQTAKKLLDIHRSTALTWAPPPGPRPAHRNSRDPERRLRVGYVSGEFVYNPAFCFLGSWLKYQNRARLESFYYMSRALSDSYTNFFREMADHWRDIAHLDDEALAARIREDRIDILVDLSGNFDDHRLGVFFERPAPVQAAFPHYPGTTGVDEIDYIFTDEWTTPAGTEDEYTERVYRLPSGYIVYQLASDPPEVNPLPAHTNGCVTFGMFQRPGKYHSETWDAVASILHQVAGSRLLFHFQSLDLDVEGSTQRERLTEPLRSRGIDPSRILFRGSRRLEEHLGVVAEADIALDSFPYNGQTTTCDCLWMGVPVVSVRGSSHVSRVGQALLERAGLGDFAAHSLRDYISLAVRLAGNLETLAALRAGLRSRACDALGNGARLAAEIEDGYRWMWKQWCDGTVDGQQLAQHTASAPRKSG
jgi:predicted O-linked N-acetylglucosamine transferase (SPINDLY family)